MKKWLSLLTVALLVISLWGCTPKKNKYTDYSFDYFDTATTLVGYANSKEEFDGVCARIKEQLGEYHRLYDIYHRYEGINNLCTVNDRVEGAHRPVEVDGKIIDLLVYAKELYALTGGKMNVAMGSVLSLWHQYRTAGISDPATAALPPMDQLQQAALHTDMEQVIIDEAASTVFLADPAMSLDVGAVAKGYATEQVARSLEQQGITGYILNVGGNVRCVGSRPNGEPWAVGIENPNAEDRENPYVAYLRLADRSLVTSGSYQRYYTVNGVRYHHIIDPVTLMPGTNYMSVSVLCADSGRADALSTALFSMSYEEGAKLIEGLADVEAMWVMADGEQNYSSGFKTYTDEQE